MEISPKDPKIICKIKRLIQNILKGESSSMSMFNDIDWTVKGNSKICISDSKQVKNYAKRFPRGHWSFFGPGDEEKQSRTYTYKPTKSIIAGWGRQENPPSSAKNRVQQFKKREIV